MNSFSFRSYFKFLGRNKGYTAINLVGFSISLAFVILLSLYVRDELSIDRLHEHRNSIYRLENEQFAGVAYPIGEELKTRYPEIESFTRLLNEEMVLTYQDRNVMTDLLLVDSTFFDIFSFPLRQGNRSNVLESRQDAVVTESFARTTFGTESAVGKTFQIDSVSYTVTGVAADFENSHIDNPDVLIRVENCNRYYKAYNNAGAFLLYVKTFPGTDFPSKAPDIIEYFKEYYWPYKSGYAKELNVVPLNEIYFNPPSRRMNGTLGNSRTFIYILLVAALAILFFAVMNYINLSVAQSGFRAKEAGIRRLLGGSQGALFLNYIWESVIFAFGAFCLALFIATLFEVPFNRLLVSQVNILGTLQVIHVISALGGVFLLGCLSGLMPAYVVTRFTPIDIVRGTFKRKTKMVYSRIFICIQYTITIILLGCALTIMRQTYFMRTTDLGFERHNVIVMDNMLNPDRLPGLRDRLMQISGVEAVSFTAGTPIDGGNNHTVNYEDEKSVSFQSFEVDSVFWQIMNIEEISRTGSTSPNAVWVNQELLRELELPDNATHFKMYQTEEIAGVYKDFHFRDLTQKIGPMVIRFFNPDQMWPWTILVKISGGNPGEIYRQVTEAYLDYNGKIPFDSFFMDEKINSWYDEQEKTYKIISYFSFLAIVIAALGLLAMATYFMRQQATNVAVRKVFGSTNREILEQLIGSFLKIVAVSFVIAVPVIWYAMTQWLKGYAYHIKLDWTIFAVAGGIAFLIAFAAVFWQSYRATIANPIDSLKNQ